MGLVIITESNLENIADAIRAKLGTSETFTPTEMASAINSIQGGNIFYLEDVQNGSGYELQINKISAASSAITPYGCVNITENGVYDIAEYSQAAISVPLTPVDGLIDGTMGNLVTYAPAIRSYAFYTDTGLVSAYAPSAQTIGMYAFGSCTALETIECEAVREVMNSAFYSCLNLKTVYLPNVLTIASYAFAHCSAIESIDVSEVREIMPGAFLSCSRIQDISIPNALSIGSFAFGYCSTLQSISLPNVLSLSYAAFAHCFKLESVYLLGGAVPYILSSSNSGPFPNTPITNSEHLGYFGSIFVPSYMYSEYVTARGWSYLSSRITSYIGENP